jgi:hypothetical protein
MTQALGRPPLRDTRPMADEVNTGGAVTNPPEPSPAKQATVNPESRPPGLEDENGGGHRLRRLSSALVTPFGAVSLVGGLTWVLLNLHGPAPAVDIATGAVLALGGLVLLMPHRIRLPRVATWIAAAVAGVGGTAAGLAAGTATACCMFAYIEGRGFPFLWLQRGGVADDPEVARRLAAADSWGVDVSALMMNAIVWAYLGVLVVALAVLMRRATGRR